MATKLSDDDIVRQVVENLAVRFPTISRDEIRDVVMHEFAAFAGRPIKDFLSILTERAARRRLEEPLAS